MASGAKSRTLEPIAAQFEARAEDSPLHVALAGAIAGAIEAGSLPPGEAMPSERAIGEALGLSRVTVRHAVGTLVEQGLLQRRHGARTMVAARVEKQLSALMSFSEEIRARGMAPGVRRVSAEVSRPNPDEVMALRLSPGEKVVRLRRVRLADGTPIALERTSVPQRLLPSPDFEGDSLYAALGALGHRPVNGTQRIRAGIASPEECALLEAGPVTALLIIERRCFLQDGQPVEMTRTSYHADHYDFVTELGEL